MEIKLEEVKNYLRVDTTEDDGLISSLLLISEKLCFDVLRINGYEDLDNTTAREVLRIPILYTVAYLYEHREEANFKELTLTLRSLLFGMRRGGF